MLLTLKYLDMTRYNVFHHFTSNASQGNRWIVFGRGLVIFFVDGRDDCCFHLCFRSEDCLYPPVQLYDARLGAPEMANSSQKTFIDPIRTRYEFECLLMKQVTASVTCVTKGRSSRCCRSVKDFYGNPLYGMTRSS